MWFQGRYDAVLSLAMTFLAILGIFHISELGTTIAAVEQASFHAARSQFVDDDAKGFAQKNVKSIDDSYSNPLKKYSLALPSFSTDKKSIQLNFNIEKKRSWAET